MFNRNADFIFGSEKVAKCRARISAYFFKTFFKQKNCCIYLDFFRI